MSATPAALKSARRMRRLFPWLSGLILVAGIVAFTIAYFGTNTAKPLPSVATPTRPVQVVKPEKGVPAPKEAKLVAAKFILTAVQRKHLDRALPLVTGSIRQGMTRKEWMTGNIPVVPWLGRIGLTPLKVDYSHPREVEFTVAILPAKGEKTKADYFVIVLKKVGSGQRARWLVDQWVPRDAPPIPANPVG
ncbi:MAG: hypothetical protein QOD08_670 [Gaiellaceae bacterium]|jgi:hypothetical protein|nr:hypothetical protein [Gaiellaceae bacterium]MDX6482399.1 hypothetical protein [Gaiellaceae bacterium]MDX6509509.1 hypothetical protein [Gaiellaceae bacterium]